MKTLKFSLPQGFTVGHGRSDMSPTVPVMMGGGWNATEVRDPLYATCTAISDGENVVLLYHMDMKDMPRAIFLNATAKIFEKTGVPEENVILNATHTHNCPHTSSMANEAAVRWRERVAEAAAEAGEAALKDLAPATISIGYGDSYRLNFVRRYLMPDGTYKMNASSKMNPVAHESEADPEFRVIRFTREGKKDIVLVNWQCHCATSQGYFRESVSADIVEIIRMRVEKDADVHFAYHNGHSANINTLDALGNKLHKLHLDMADEFANRVLKVLENMTPVESGKVRIDTLRMEEPVQKDSEERRAGALEWARASAEARPEVLKKYGFDSMYEAIAINTRAGMKPVDELHITALSFGDIAFTTMPFEAFDQNGIQIRKASPCKMTFTCAYTNGALGYMPAEEIFPHGGYEVYVSRFEKGTPEKCVKELVRMLNEQKSLD